MKKNNFWGAIKLLMLALAISLGNLAEAQTIDAQNTYELSRKARKGDFAGAFLQDDGNTSLVYVIKQNNKRIVYEEYIFDDKYAFVEKKNYEEELEKYRKKFKIKIRLPEWQKKHDGKNKFVHYTMAAYKNTMNTLILYKIEETYKWSHRYNKFFLEEEKKVEKVKMKDEDTKYLAWSWALDEEKQQMLVIASKAPRLAKMTKGADFSGMDLGYKALTFDKDLNLIKEVDINVPKGSVIKMNALVPKKGTQFKGLAQKGSPIIPVSTVFYNPLVPFLGMGAAVVQAFKNKPVYDMAMYAFEDDEYVYDLYNSDVMLIFATENATQQVPWKAKELETFEFKPTKYQYVRLTNQGDIIEQGKLDGMNDYIQGTFDDNAILAYHNSSYFLYARENAAPTNGGKPIPGSTGNTRYITTKFNSDFNSVSWSTLVESQDFATNMTSPNPLADLKKSAVKNLGIGVATANNIYLGSEGGNHIAYGNTAYTALGIVMGDDGKYKGNFQLGAGSLTELNKGKPTGTFLQTEMVRGASQNDYFIIFEQRMVGGKKPQPTADISPRIATVSREGKLTGNQYYGLLGKKEVYYLDTQMPVMPTKAGTIGFFGDDKKGKVIWMCRVKLD